jgi:hypothetical protein
MSVQEHAKHLAIFGRLLKDALSATTRGLCDADMHIGFYPDLHVFLMRNSTSGTLESDRSDCLLALLGSLRQIRPDEAMLKDAVLRAMKDTVHWLAPTSVAIEATADVFDALTHIYDANTVMSALVSVRLPELTSVDFNSFLSWLDRQNAERREALIPLQTCVAHAGSRTRGVLIRRRPELQSGVVPPGVIKLTLDRSNILTRRPLRRLVIVGVSKELAEEKPFKPCEHKTITIPSTRSLSRDGTIAVPIQCVQMTPVYTDWWVAFYCDPNDCQSEIEEKTALEEIARSRELLTILSARSSGTPARGPYLIEVDPQSK